MLEKNQPKKIVIIKSISLKIIFTSSLLLAVSDLKIGLEKKRATNIDKK